MRAARIKKLLKDPSWNWCDLATFYFTVLLVGTVVVLVLNATDALDGIGQVTEGLQYAVATLLLPGGLTLLNILVQVCNEVIAWLVAMSVVGRWSFHYFMFSRVVFRARFFLRVVFCDPGPSTCSSFGIIRRGSRVPQTSTFVRTGR